MWLVLEHSSLQHHTTSLNAVLTSMAAVKGTHTTMAMVAKEDKTLEALATMQDWDSHSSFSEGIQTKPNKQTKKQNLFITSRNSTI